MPTQYLDGIATFVTAKPILTSFCATAVLGVSWVLNDFYSWKSFGTGGTPPTWAGYWRMTKIRVKHTLSKNNLLDPSPLSKDGPSFLGTIAQRRGPAPRIMPRTMPQRQRPESITSAARSRLQSLMQTLAASHPDILEIKPSHTEGKSTDGLYAQTDAPKLNPIAKDKILNHEIAHAHPADNSLHVWLSDPDARTVIEAGWGQRFPLVFVKSGWTMVYAPRDEVELETVEIIVKAGVAFITGTEI